MTTLKPRDGKGKEIRLWEEEAEVDLQEEGLDHRSKEKTTLVVRVLQRERCKKKEKVTRSIEQKEDTTKWNVTTYNR